MTLQSKPVFSRLQVVDALPSSGATVHVEATAAEREALSTMDGLLAIGELFGDYEMRSRKSGEVSVIGRIHARVTQTCSVSLDPFEAAIVENVDLVFMPEEGVTAWINKAKTRAKEEPGLEDEDPPDSIVDGRIDLGVVTAEFLALAIDPYPRKPGVDFDAAPYENDKDESPFAALASLKKDD